VAQASLRWLIATWHAITQLETPPPLSSAVLLADDHRVWKPAAHRKLWQRLRVTTLYAIWNASKLARGEQPHTAAGIAAFVVHTHTKAIRQDWCRVQAKSNRGLAALTTGQMSSEWLRGRSPLMPMPEFEDFWCVHNVLCDVTNIHTLRVHWTLAHPVPVQVLRECIHTLAGQAEGILGYGCRGFRVFDCSLGFLLNFAISF
jgi:hypothetical protein